MEGTEKSTANKSAFPGADIILNITSDVELTAS